MRFFCNFAKNICLCIIASCLNKPLSVDFVSYGFHETIRPYVDEFIWFAKQHPELTFLVTRIGCGIAGFTDDEISPLFKEAHEVDNIVLPPGW